MLFHLPPHHSRSKPLRCKRDHKDSSPQSLVLGSLFTPCVLLLLGHSLAISSDLAFEPPRNLSSNAGVSVLPRISVQGSEISVVWRDDSVGNREIFFVHSDDNGLTFSPVLNVSENSGDSSGLSAIPPQIVATGDTIHVVWIDDTPGYFAIFYRRSTDGGKTFDPVQILSMNPSNSDTPQLAAIGSNVYVVWQDAGPSSTDIFYRRSTNGGVSFDPVQNLSTSTTFALWPQLAIAGNSLFIAWSDGLPGSTDVYFRRSADGGVSFEETVNLSDNPGNSGPFYGGLSLVAAGSNVHVAWEDDTPGNADMLYRRSTDAGMSFGPAQNLSSSPGDAGSPQIGLSGSNIVNVVWHDEPVPGTGRDILYRRSVDNGTTFEPLVNLSDSPEHSEIPAMSIRGSSIFITWDHHSPIPSEVLLRHSGDSGASFDPAQNVSSNGGESFGCQVGLNDVFALFFWSDITPGNAEIFFRRAVPEAFLRFPLCDADEFTGSVCATNVDPSVWPVTAILDHSGGYYTEVDGRVLPFSTELVCDPGDGGTSECDGELLLGSNGPPQSGYRLDCAGTPVDFGGRLAYVGVVGGDAGLCNPIGNVQPIFDSARS